MTEQWIQGCDVERIMFRDGLVLNFDDYNELVIAVPFRLTLPAISSPQQNDPEETVTVDPNRARREERALFDFAGARCTAAHCDDTGHLRIDLSSGHRIDVPASDEHTAWELYGKRHGYMVCLPHGRVHVVRHDLTDAGG